MSNCNTFSNILLELCNIGMKMSSCLNRSSKPYWSRTLETTQSYILKQIVQEYEVKNVPEKRRFPRLRQEFVNLYECFEDDFSRPFITVLEDGTKRINDEWIKIPGLDPLELDRLEENEYNDEKFESNIFENVSKVYNISKNRGISIVLCRKGTPGIPEAEDIDLEIPLSEMFHVAIFLKKQGLNKPLFIFCILHAIYSAFAITVPSHHEIIDIERENFFINGNINTSSITERMEHSSERLKPLLEENKDVLDSITSLILDKVRDIESEDLTEIENLTSEQLRKMNKSDKSFMDFFKDFMPGSDADSDTPSGLMGKTDSDINSLIDTLMKNKHGVDPSTLRDTIPNLDKRVEDLKIQMSSSK